MQYHLHVDEGDVAPYVLLPGDPGRVETVAALWDSAKKVAANREFVTYTGVYRGIPISCTSTGIGAPSTSIAMEELARVGASTFLRIGTGGSFQPHVVPGDLAIFDSAVRLEGASRGYAPIEFPAVASHDVVAACIRAGDALGLRYHVGTTRSADTFYAGHPQPGSSFGDFWQSSWEHRFDDLRRLGVIAAEMEASLIFVLARVWGLRAGGVSVILDDMFAPAGDGAGDPGATITAPAELIERLARMGCEAVYELATADAARAG